MEFDWQASLGKIVIASLLPIGVLIGSVYFVVDTAIRGVEQSVNVTNERITDAVATLQAIEDDLTELRVAVAQLDVSTTSKLDGIIESLREITFVPDTQPGHQYTLAATVNSTTENGTSTVRTATILTGANHDPEILSIALQEEFVALGNPGASRVCRITPSGENDCATSAALLAPSVGNSPEHIIRATIKDERLITLFISGGADGRAPFASPVRSASRFTSSFGFRRDAKTGGQLMHNGIDFAATLGTQIFATADGIVTHAGWQSGYGRLVRIRHEFGVETRYAHLESIGVKVGERVRQGEQIGTMGASGRVTGVHLHYEIRIGGKAVNPMTFIKIANDPELGELLATLRSSG